MGKEYVKAYAGLEEAHAGIKLAGRNINILRYTDDITFMAESKEEIKSLLMKLREDTEKAGLKLNVYKMKIMASSPITSWQIEGETMETVADFPYWAPKSLWTMNTTMKLKDTCFLEEKQ